MKTAAPLIEAARRALRTIRRDRPLVHNITNYVVMNSTANGLLALGASPVMAHAREEAAEMASLSGALVINIGTLSPAWIQAMFLAARAARARGIPVILDPVGAGATRLRTSTATRLMEEGHPDVLRGNASEIIALAGSAGGARGVDSRHAVAAAHHTAVDLAQNHHLTVAVTGPEDFVTDGRRVARIRNGHPLMARVTGTGCLSSAITGAFCAVEPDRFLASASALIVLGIAGEMAAEGAPGPGSFAVRLLDALAAVSPNDIRSRARVVTPP